MARQDAGRWVARAGATGGGRTYRARVPYRWYSGLALIVIVGVFLVVYSRYENMHPAASPASVAPTTSDHWVAGLDFDLCGVSQQVLSASSNATTGDLGLYSGGDGVIQIQPKTSADSGVNATVGRFSSQFPGLTLTADSVGLPKKKVYKNGTACPAGTPDAGKTGVLSAYIYPTATSTTPTQQSGDVRQVRFTQNLEIVTLAFVPSGTTPPAPSQTIKSAVINAEGVVQSESTTTTTAVTAPSSSTTATTSKTGASTSTTSKTSTSSTTATTSKSNTTTTTTAASTTSTTK
jgi:hypothetical protein